MAKGFAPVRVNPDTATEINAEVEGLLTLSIRDPSTPEIVSLSAPGPWIVMLFVTPISPVVNVIGLVTLAAKSTLVGGVASACAAAIVARKLPAPVSALVVTVNVDAGSGDAATRKAAPILAASRFGAHGRALARSAGNFRVFKHAPTVVDVARRRHRLTEGHVLGKEVNEFKIGVGEHFLRPLFRCQRSKVVS